MSYKQAVAQKGARTHLEIPRAMVGSAKYGVEDVRGTATYLIS